MARKRRKGSRNKQLTNFKPPKEMAGSAGVWSGDGYAQVRIRLKFVGTAPMLLRLIPDFSKDPPSVAEPVFSMCLRAAAHYSGSMLKRYVPKKDTRDFLPFLMVDKCTLKFEEFRRTNVPIVITDSGGKEEVVGHEPMNRVDGWSIDAEIVIAHFPGVDYHGIMTLFEKAGTEVGLGAQRPHNGGKFGTFQLADIKEISGKWPPMLDRTRRNNEAFIDVGEQIAEVCSVLGVGSAAASG